MIGALRFCACSRDSRTRMPAPSPTTNPSRPASHGRLACAGSSLRVESAFMAANPPMPMGVMVASAPPQIIISAAPRSIILKESPTACAEAEHAVAVAEFVEIRILGLPVSRFHGKIRAGQPNLDEARHFLEFFFFDPLEGVEVLHLAAEFAIETGSVERRDRGDAAASGEEVSPAFLRADAQRADQPNTRNDYPASHRSDTPC